MLMSTLPPLPQKYTLSYCWCYTIVSSELEVQVQKAYSGIMFYENPSTSSNLTEGTHLDRNTTYLVYKMGEVGQKQNIWLIRIAMNQNFWQQTTDSLFKIFSYLSFLTSLPPCPRKMNITLNKTLKNSVLVRVSGRTNTPLTKALQDFPQSIPVVP